MKRIVLSAALALILAGAASASNAPHVQERIVPGTSIGKVRIGMSLEQVKAALGQPESVIERERRGFSREWVEYSWSFTSWRVGFEVRRGRSVAVSIRSSSRAERSPEGIGYGALASRVQRVYRTQCRPAFDGFPNSPDPTAGFSRFVGYACVAGPRTRSMFFLVSELCGNVPTASGCASRDRRWGVVEFGVLRTGERLPFELGHFNSSFPELD